MFYASQFSNRRAHLIERAFFRQLAAEHPRGNYQKFDREVYPTLASASRATGLDTVTGWFNELVGTDPEGNRKIYGSWPGMGPEWGDLAVKKLHEMGRESFLWSYQSGRSDPWVLIGPTADPLLSIVWQSFYTLEQALEWWQREKDRIEAEIAAGREPPPPIVEPDYTPIDPGEVSAPPIDPATGQTTIDPPATRPPITLPKEKPWWQKILSGLPGLGGPRRPPGGRYPPGQYPPGTYPPGGPWGPGGILGTSDSEWMYLGAAALLLFAAARKKKKKGRHANAH